MSNPERSFTAEIIFKASRLPPPGGGSAGLLYCAVGRRLVPPLAGIEGAVARLHILA